MSFKILSGTGTGKEACVDNTNRVCVRSISESESDESSVQGQRYNINTGDITLTSANESAVLYFKNNEDYEFVINTIIYNIDDSTGGTAAVTVDVYFKTTGGTIVSGATDVDMNVNLNLASANTLTADAYKGAEGNTQIGGVQAVSSLIQPGGRAAVSLGKVIIPKGQSIAITMTPPSGNTSIKVQAALSGYVATPSVLGT